MFDVGIVNVSQPNVIGYTLERLGTKMEGERSRLITHKKN